jgi:DNA repair protein RecO (recombination protein O)
MNQIITKGIILTRTDYGEADRIITLLTPDQGKIRLLARGVRRIKSKLAGGIELFSVSDIAYIRGRGELGTLISSRLQKHFMHIVSDISRTMLGYELIKQLNKETEDTPEPAYFDLLIQLFDALDDTSINVNVIKIWYAIQLLSLGGHTPNLYYDDTGCALNASLSYNFDHYNMAFTPIDSGKFNAKHIKFLRLGFSGNSPKILEKVQVSIGLVNECSNLVDSMQVDLLRA